VLGNLIMSTVGPGDRNDASGLTNAGGQLGQSLGTAVIGTVAVATLTSVFVAGVIGDERVPPDVAASIEREAEAELSFVSDEEIRGYLEEGGLEASVVDPVVASYGQAQLDALRIAMFAAATIVLIALFLARNLPTSRPRNAAEKQDAAQPTD